VHFVYKMFSNAPGLLAQSLYSRLCVMITYYLRILRCIQKFPDWVN